MRTTEFETGFNLAQIKAILVENLGVWSACMVPKDVSKSDAEKYKNYSAYVWRTRKIAFLLSEGSDKQYVLSWSIFGNRQIKKTVSRLTLEDQHWLFRKLLNGVTNQYRLKLHDARAYVPFAILGAALASLSLFFAINNVNLPFQFSLLGTIVTALVYGLHRYAVSIESIDLRFMAIALEYMIALCGVPVAIAVIYIGNYLVPFVDSFTQPINIVLYMVILFIVFAVIYGISILILKKPLLNRIEQNWSSVRMVLDSDESVWKPKTEKPIGLRVGHIGQKRLYGVFGIAMTIGVSGFIYSSWFYIVQTIEDFQTGFDWVPYAIFALIIVLAWNGITLGDVFGLTHSEKQLTKDDFECNINEHGLVEFKPTNMNYETLVRIIHGESTVLSFE